MSGIRISEEAQKLINDLARPEQWLFPAIAKGMNLANEETLAHIQENRMKGNNGKPWPPEEHVLGVRTGRLRGSLRASKAVISGQGVRSTIGTNVRYAAVHEFGFDGEVTVRPHARRRYQVMEFLRPSKAKDKALGKYLKESAKAEREEDVPDYVGAQVTQEELGKRVVRKRVRRSDVSVGLFKRRMRIAARAPITTGVEDMLGRYGEIVSGAIVEAGRRGA